MLVSSQFATDWRTAGYAPEMYTFIRCFCYVEHTSRWTLQLYNLQTPFFFRLEVRPQLAIKKADLFSIIWIKNNRSRWRHNHSPKTTQKTSRLPPLLIPLSLCVTSPRQPTL